MFTPLLHYLEHILSCANEFCVDSVAWNVELAALRRVFRKAAEAGLVDWGKAEACGCRKLRPR